MTNTHDFVLSIRVRFTQTLSNLSMSCYNADMSQSPLPQKSNRKFNQRFKTFLELVGVNYHEYCNETFSTADGKSITLNEIDQTNVQDFAWAKFLAEKHALILINSNQDTLDSLTEFEMYQDGLFNQYLKTVGAKMAYYRDDIRSNDAGRFELAKDLQYFLRDVCGNISKYRSVLLPIYIETNDPATFLFGIYHQQKHQKGLPIAVTKKLRSLAKSIGLYVIPATGSFPKIQIKPLHVGDNSDGFTNGVLVDKHYVLETRNNQIIAELKAKKQAARKKEFDEYLQKAEPVTQNNDNFTPLTHGFKSGDKVQCFIFDTKYKLEVSSVNKDDGELLDDDELDEVNWLIKSNLMDDRQIQFQVLEAINERYEAWCDGTSHKKNLKREFKITTILIDIQQDNTNGKTTPIIAFAGEANCDEEHGLSVTFTNRKFSGVDSFMEFNYGETGGLDFKKWWEAHPLATIYPEHGITLIDNGYTDERNICLGCDIYLGNYKSAKRNLKKWLLNRNRPEDTFKWGPLSVKNHQLLIFEQQKGKALAECLDNHIQIDKADIVKSFALRKDYKINGCRTNHFVNLHFVLKDKRILILASYDNATVNFLIKEFGIK